MNEKKLILFMPSIEGGGVEKNFIIISNYIATKFKKTKIITSNKSHKRFFKNLDFVTPSININNKSRRFKYLFCLYELIKIIFNDQNYVVFAFQANVYCALICKFLKIKIITRSNSSPSGWKLTFFRRLIFKFLLSLPNKIIVNSEEFKKEYKEIFGLKVSCIYNPLNKNEIIKYSKKKIKEKFFKNFKKLKIIFVGRFVDQKDPITFLKALNSLKNHNDFRALVIGKGYLLNKMKNYIFENKLSKKIKIIGWKKNPYKYIKNADILVSSSKFEGLPNTLIETVALKKPIISTNCPTGPKEILINGKGGSLCNVGDYKKIFQYLMKYKKNKKDFQKKAMFSYKKINRFDYDKNLKKYYQEIKLFL